MKTNPAMAEPALPRRLADALACHGNVRLAARGLFVWRKLGLDHHFQGLAVVVTLLADQVPLP